MIMLSTRGNKSSLLSFALIILAAIAFFLVNDLRSIYAVLDGSSIGKVILVFSQIFFALHLSIFIWRIVLCLKYKQVNPCSDLDLPTCLVIVPAYNEGSQVFSTISSIVQSDYPAEKISVIGIDDGSQDDTWLWLKKAESEFPDRVKIFKQPKNKGKRHALYKGFSHGKCDVFVTIDSDSTVAPHTIRHLVSPIATNPHVGAVAGNVRILNGREGAIPKMLEVAFAYSFDFLRAGQSVINSVMCTPGALSAYRRSVVVNVLEEWVNQKFCGKAANIGEDRAMTNLILKNGYHVLYQREAVVYTTVPITVSKLWKMLLRWARSNVRESIVIARFAFSRFRTEGALGLRINVIVGLINLTMGQMMRLSAVALLIMLPAMVAWKLAIGVALASCAPGVFYAIRYKSNHAIWALPYSFFYMSCLSWTCLYALMSPHKTGWMTRNLDIGNIPDANYQDNPSSLIGFRDLPRKAA